jgi:O-antigen ligase
VNLMEFGGNSAYLVWTTSTGLVGLMALVWLLLFALGRAAAAQRNCPAGPDRGLALGAVGSLAAMAGGMFFTEYVIRGVGVALVFVLALSCGLAEGSEPARDGQVRTGAD